MKFLGILLLSVHLVLMTACANQSPDLTVRHSNEGGNIEMLDTEGVARGLDAGKADFPHADNLPGSKDIVGKEYRFPDILKATSASYPKELRHGNDGAEVHVRVLISEEGDVIGAGISGTTDPRYNQAALDSVRMWKFSPATIDGKPCKGVVTAPIVFRLED